MEQADDWTHDIYSGEYSLSERRSFLSYMSSLGRAIGLTGLETKFPVLDDTL